MPTSRTILEQAASDSAVAYVSSELGQPPFGVPTYLAMSMAPQTDRPSAQWFIGDVAPQGNLLPTVVGVEYNPARET